MATARRIKLTTIGEPPGWREGGTGFDSRADLVPKQTNKHRMDGDGMTDLETLEALEMLEDLETAEENARDCNWAMRRATSDTDRLVAGWKMHGAARELQRLESICYWELDEPIYPSEQEMLELETISNAKSNLTDAARNEMLAAQKTARAARWDAAR